MHPTLSFQRQGNLLHRPHLIERLQQHLDRALTFVCAPAGFGKTFLLRDFKSRAPFPVCWHTLEPADHDRCAFARRLSAALCRRFPGFGSTISLTLNGNAGSEDPSGLATAIVQEMLDHIPEFFVLILDDYHVVDDGRETNALLGTFLLHRPAHCHTILAGRTAPLNLPIIQLTAQAQIAGLGPEHLAFSAGEVRDLLAHAHNVHLSPAQAEELAVCSGGWIAAILGSTQAMWRGIRDNLIQADVQRVLRQPLGVLGGAQDAVLEQTLEKLGWRPADARNGRSRSSDRGERPWLIAASSISEVPSGSWFPLGNGRWVLEDEPQTAHNAPGNPVSYELLQVSDLAIDVTGRQVRRRDQTLALSRLEFDLLVYLAQRRPQALSYDELLEQVWGYVPDCRAPKLVRMAISRLRRSLNDDPARPRYIANVRGVGYRAL